MRGADFRRLPRWRTRLATALRDSAAKPFSWEEQHDCCMGHVFPAVEAVCGLDLRAGFAGQYTTAIGALLALRRQGHAGIIELFEATFEQCAPSMARVGDIVGVQNEEGEWAMGIVIGARAAFLRPDGPGTVDLTKCDKAFRVG